MNREEIKTFLKDIKKNFQKQINFAKKNILNNTERIVRKCFGGEIEVTITNAVGQNITIRATSVPYTPEKQKDQTFHRLDLRADFGDGTERDITPDMLDIESVLNLYDAAWTIADEQADIKDGED